jgi:hypothetical protein
VVRLHAGASGAREVAAWADEIHVQEQEKNPDDSYKGVLREQVFSNNRWCFIGSFSINTLKEIRQHPQVGKQRGK